ncbi:unnamed protein product [Symbiodinium natans]|uniref:EF-hand domain-containing protein n=1 Tax=Symbiodinium natans TaxID=878477 RepID=A0A812Q2C2_9DINO|nr:unnamed protein product [Symbiodinium natans]
MPGKGADGQICLSVVQRSGDGVAAPPVWMFKLWFRGSRVRCRDHDPHPAILLALDGFAAWLQGAQGLQVMPRVATGFISFLSLQVFRTLAYSLIPKQTSALLWMDVTMFEVTVIMFASVLENVLAQAMRATVSTYSARFVDDVSRISFPLVGVVVLTVLFVMGAANVETTWIMTVSLLITTGWLVGYAAAVYVYVRYLPHRLMNILIRQISSSDFRYQKAMVLDQKELAMIFRAFDEDGTGDLSAEEVLESFEHRGLSFKDADDEQNFKTRLKLMFRQKAGNRLDLNAFCHHFGELFRYHAAADPSEADSGEVREAQFDEEQSVRSTTDLHV